MSFYLTYWDLTSLKISKTLFLELFNFNKLRAIAKIFYFKISETSLVAYIKNYREMARAQQCCVQMKLDKSD